MLRNIPAGPLSRCHIVDYVSNSINIAFDEDRVFYFVVSFTFPPTDSPYDNHIGIPIYFHLQDVLPQDVYFVSSYLLRYDVNHPGGEYKTTWITLRH